MASTKVLSGAGIKWYQTVLSCPSKSRGVHKITDLFSSKTLFTFHTNLKGLNKYM